MKSSSGLILTVASIFASLASATTASAQLWKYDVTICGVAFSKARTTDNALIIGYTRKDQMIGGRPCRKGWVHLFSNGTPAGFTSWESIELDHSVIPPGTWVFQNRGGVITVCSFPHDTEIQGHICRGGEGGSEGVQTAFYPSGRLKQFFATTDVNIDGVPCSSSLFLPGIELNENGRLHSATLSSDFMADGQTLMKGTRIRLAPDGRIVSGSNSTSKP